MNRMDSISEYLNNSVYIDNIETWKLYFLIDDEKMASYLMDSLSDS